ncbi:MAG TPA: phosphoglycerate mutase family protein [Vicinamibacterales bacterium]|nr:phosphoglycerate mutase family protein [Vicinamibacterales bacterium]
MTTIRRLLLAMALIALAAPQVSAQNTVFVVRHAEKAVVTGQGGMMAEDPDLSDEGRARAESLAGMLKAAGIKAIFATEYKRTRQTVEPLAKALGIQVTRIGSRETAQLVEMVRKADGNVLVAGHSNTVPEVLKMLGIQDPVTIDESEYDNLFIVSTGAQPHMVRLHFR